MSIDGIGSGLSASTQNNINRASERISSGNRINSAADDASGQAITDRLTRQISGFGQSVRNINDGISLAQTADGALSGITEGIQRIRELALQAANGTLNASDRANLNAEARQIREEINRTVESTNFNGKPLLNSDSTIALQSGPEAGDQIDLRTRNFSQLLDDSGFNDIDLSSAEGAQAALAATDSLQADVNDQRAELGAMGNRFDSTVNTLMNSEISATATRSRIADADIAKEVSDLIQNQVKQDAQIAMQVQANQNQKSVLRYLQF